MGLLENTIGAMLGHGDGQGSDRPLTSSPYAPLATALIGLLAAKAATGGFGDLGGLLGSKHGTAPAPDPQPAGGRTSAGGPGAPAAGGGLLAGLGALVEKFKSSGQGNLVDSWIGGGANHPTSPQQVTDALGSDTVHELAQRTGMSPSDVAAQLSQALPGIIDRLTPAGRLPRHDELPR